VRLPGFRLEGEAAKLATLNLNEVLDAFAARAARGGKTTARNELFRELDAAGAVVRIKSTKMARRPKGEKTLEETQVSDEASSLSILALALLAAQREIDVALKDGENTYFSTKDKTASYATLSSVIDAVKPILNKHGIVFIQALTPPPYEGCLALTTTLIHAESGQNISGTAVVPLAKNDPQGFGSAVTYTRRYALTAILGLKTEDDDGNAASNLPAPRQQAARPRPERIETPTGPSNPAPTGWGTKAKKTSAPRGHPPRRTTAKAPPRGKTGVFPTVAKGQGQGPGREGRPDPGPAPRPAVWKRTVLSLPRGV
jgi:hypothetical protein